MSIKGQLSQNYNATDEVGNLHDIKKVLSLAGDKAKGFEQRVLDILSGKQEDQERQKTLVTLRNGMFTALRGSLPIAEQKHQFTGLDRINMTYQKEYNFYNHLATNPDLRAPFLSALDQAIGSLLEQEGGGAKSLNIAQKMESLTQENWNSTLTEIEGGVGHVGVVYFLEECIREEKYLEKMKSYINRKYSQDGFSTGDIQTIDFSNLRSQFAFKQKLEAQSDAMKNGKSFSLSGGVSNALAELGYIREFYRNGGVIRSITGTSMGAIVAVMVSKAVGTQTGAEAVVAIDGLIKTLSNELQRQIDLANQKLQNQKPSNLQKALHTFTIGKIPLPRSLSALRKNNTEELEQAFKNVAHSLGITDNAKFRDLDIPVLINASRQYGHTGEKEVIISGDMPIVDALIVTGNMPGSGSENIGMFGERKLLGLPLVDYAANEQGNMVSHLTDAGINPQDIVALDVGYSSNQYNHIMAQLSRILFPRARSRDFSIKNYLRMNGGRADDLNTEGTENNGGEAFSHHSLALLVENGTKKYTSISQSLPQPSPQ